MRKFRKSLFAIALTLFVATSSMYQPFYSYAFGVTFSQGSRILDQNQMTLAKDVTYTWYDMTIKERPEKVHVIEFDLNNPNLELQLAKSNGYVYGFQDVAGTARAYDAVGNRVIAGINGDFYHMDTGIPIGLFINEGEILVTPPQNWNAFGIKKDNSTIMGKDPILRKELRFGNKNLTISHVNRIEATGQALVLFTPHFSTSTRTDNNRDEYVCDVLYGKVQSEEYMILRVAEVRRNAGNTPLKEGQVVISASGQFKDHFSGVNVGDTMFTYFELEEGWKDVEMAVGGETFVVRNGQVVSNTSTALHPRSAIGVKADGKIIMLQVDGRSPGFSEGLTLQELGTLMKDLGAVAAINLDGGGSSTIVARLPGSTAKTILNKPSDGSARRVANSLLLIDKSQEGQASQFVVQPNTTRVLTGSTYKFNYAAIDANYHPATFNGTVNWRVDSSVLGSITPNGVFTAGNLPGKTKIHVSSGVLTGAGEVEVVSDITRLKFEQDSIFLNSGDIRDFKVQAFRNNQSIIANGQSLKWTVEGPIGTINSQGVFTAANVTNQTGKIHVSYTNPITNQVTRTSITVTVGHSAVLLEDFENGLSGWTASGVRFNSVNLFEETNKEFVKNGNKSARLDYDFTGTIGTSGAYIAPVNNQLIDVPGYPKKIGMWVYGDGSGNWLRGQMRDGMNQIFYIDYVPSSTGVDFVGWKYVEATVPAGKTLPLKMEMPVRYMATNDAKKNVGTIYVDYIRAIYSDSVDDTVKNATFTINALNNNIQSGGSFIVNLNISNPTNAIGGEMVLAFDPTKVEAKAVVQGLKLKTNNIETQIDNVNGKLTIKYKDIESLKLQNNDLVGSILFTIKAGSQGTTDIRLESGQVLYKNNEKIPFTSNGLKINIK